MQRVKKTAAFRQFFTVCSSNQYQPPINFHPLLSREGALMPSLAKTRRTFPHTTHLPVCKGAVKALAPAVRDKSAIDNFIVSLL
jgi:hypothetical protein